MPEKDLADLLNLGEKSAQMLHDAGIHSVAQPRAMGVVEAYLTIKRQGMAVSLAGRAKAGSQVLFS